MTPILYDASEYNVEDGYVNARSKFATRVNANGVIVYAIGANGLDTSEDVDLVRKVRTSSTEKFTIDDYDAYNLVFNYYDGDGEGAWNNLFDNNYQLRKLQRDSIANGNLSDEIASDADMLAFLKANNFLIVIDNSNYEVIYDYFYDASDSDSVFYEYSSASDLLSWLQSAGDETIAALGFAYIGVDETFGATSSQVDIYDGMGTGYYYFDYIATDSEGNEVSLTCRVYVGTYFLDVSSPTITFKDSLASTYNQNSIIKLSPTATDTIDSNLTVKTLYRYLGNDGFLTADVKDNKGEVVEDFVDLSWILTEIESTKDDGGEYVNASYESYVNDYANYIGTGASGGYIDLTDESASFYSIDLINAPEDATQLQIFVYVYDDSGNYALCGKTINIANVTDESAPNFVDFDFEQDASTTYSQGETITLPTLTVSDDELDYVSYSVVILKDLIDATGNFEIDETTAEKTADSQSNLKISGGKFVITDAGQYCVSIVVKDASGNMLVAFANYNVPDLSYSVDLGKVRMVEVGETISLPVPTIDFAVYKSVTWDEYQGNETAYSDIDWVFVGVDSSGNATNYTTSLGENGVFTAIETGIYPIVYETKMFSYNPNVFTYLGEHEISEYVSIESYDEIIPSDSVGVFEYGSLKVWWKGTNFYVLDSEGNIYRLIISSYYYGVAPYSAYLYLIYSNGESCYTYCSFEDTELAEIDFEAWYSALNLYNLSSTYLVKVVDDLENVSGYELDYPEIVYSTTTDSKTITISPIDNFDTGMLDENVDLENSYIQISATLEIGSVSSKIFCGADAWEEQEYSLKTADGKLINGTYTIVYCLYDINGNVLCTRTYTIIVKDFDLDEDDFTLSVDMPASQTIDINDYERGDTFSISPPSLSYDIEGLINYEDYILSTSTYEDDETILFAILGLDENDVPYFSTSLGPSNALDVYSLGFGEHSIVYSVNLIIYDFRTFSYVEEYYDTEYHEGNYFVFRNLDSNITQIYVTENGYTIVTESNSYDVEYVDCEWVINGTAVEDYQDEFTLSEMVKIADRIRFFSYESETYTIIIEDNVKPVIYPQTYASTINDYSEKTLTIYGVKATDVGGIDVYNCSISISWTLTNGETGNYEWQGVEAFSDVSFDLIYNDGTLLEGVYYITYLVYDVQGNYETSTYRIVVADNTPPTMTIEDAFVESSYEKSSVLKLELKNITFEDSCGIDEDTISFSLLNPNGNKVSLSTDSSVDEDGVITDLENGILSYNLNSVGVYTLKIDVYDIAGWLTTKEIYIQVFQNYQILTNNAQFGSVSQSELTLYSNVQIYSSDSVLHVGTQEIEAICNEETECFEYAFAYWQIDENSATAVFQCLTKKFENTSEENSLEVYLENGIESGFSLNASKIETSNTYANFKNGNVIAGYDISISSANEILTLSDSETATVRIYLEEELLKNKNIKVYLVCGGEIKELSYVVYTSTQTKTTVSATSESSDYIEFKIGDFGEVYVVSENSSSSEEWILPTIFSLLIVVLCLNIVLFVLFIKRNRKVKQV